MGVYDGRGLMVAQATSFPIELAVPRMAKAALDRLELQLWSDGPVNHDMPPAQADQYHATGLALTAWSTHRPGEHHPTVLIAIADLVRRYRLGALNLNLEAGWYVERDHDVAVAYPACFTETASLLAAVDDELGPGFPAAVTITPAKVYPFAMLEARNVEVFVELYDDQARPLQNVAYQWALTLEQTRRAGIDDARVHRCVSKQQLPCAGSILVYLADAMDEGDYR